MSKIDYKKEWSHLYQPSAKEASIVNIPAMNYLMIDGEGNPNTAQSFQDAVNVLFPLSYTLKCMAKNGVLGKDYVVMPLEGLWWSEDISSFSMENKDDWKWTLMIMQPPFISLEMIEEAKEQVQTKKNPSALPLVYFESLEEGKAAQIMHLGPFSTEGPTVAKLHDFIEHSGHQRRDKHHEIYLKDMRKSMPENWTTIIRHPIV